MKNLIDPYDIRLRQWSAPVKRVRKVDQGRIAITLVDAAPIAAPVPYTLCKKELAP